ncbi:hypothetical protein B0H10DRAFT_2233984 [Mycena sp. CBHHK59/15]|nr:hypothetical protein B0H10DRAFT_2233984 [Mycena sp. CBHHK59/15]
MTSPPALALVVRVVGAAPLRRRALRRRGNPDPLERHRNELRKDEGGFSGSDDSDDNSGSNGDDDSGDDGTSSEDEGEDEPKAKKPTKGSAAISAKNLPRNPNGEFLEFIEDESDDEILRVEERKAGDTDEEPAAKKRKAGDGKEKKKTADDDDNYDFPVGPPRGKKKASEQLTKPKKNAPAMPRPKAPSNPDPV